MDQGMKIADFAENPLDIDPNLECYGIEIEAEQYPTRRWTADASMLAPYWRLEKDGSLRNNGVEFVSRPTPAAAMEDSAIMLYTQTGKHWRPSIRTGIHIHSNMLGRTLAEVQRVCAYYAFAEPLLFDMVGVEREENIYCVPWYRAPTEAHNIRECLTEDIHRLRDLCKYTALFAGPLRNYGSIEFRHAPTFTTARELLSWWKVCQAISNSWSMPDPLRLYAQTSTAHVLKQLFGTLFPDDYYVAMAYKAEELGCHEIALSFQPYTYNFGPWGKPGEFQVETRPPVEVAEKGLDEVLDAITRDRLRVRRAEIERGGEQILAVMADPEEWDEGQDEDQEEL